MFEVAVDVDALGQLVPVVCGVTDSGVDEEVKHLEGVFRVVLYHFFIERNDVVVANAESRGVEIEFGLLFGSDADANLHWYVGVGDGLVEHMHLVFVVDDRHDVVESVFVQFGNIVDILLTLETVAYNEYVFVNQAVVVELLDEVDVEGRRGLQIDVVFQGLLQHETEVTAFGAVAVVVCAFVVHLGYSHIEQAFGALDRRTYLGQISDF